MASSTSVGTGDLLHCPIRGQLVVRERAADGLAFSEEKHRIDAIAFLLAKGYPATHMRIETKLLRFGNGGRNSFRTDLAVLDVPATSIGSSPDEVNPHIILIAEIKRDNKDAALAKETQVYPALHFIPNLEAMALYWDGVERRLFHRKLSGSTTKIYELPLALLPRWGAKIGTPSLQLEHLQDCNLLELFRRIEDVLHSHVADQSRRFVIMLQLLIAKLFDEHHVRRGVPMELQDLTDAPMSDGDVVRYVEKLLAKAVDFYGRYLPDKISSKLGIPGDLLRRVTALLAPIGISNARREVIQDFYMYFAKGVYKWDLGQFFTPTEVVDFIVQMMNPRSGEQIADPACGSGDFLISALHFGREHDCNFGDAIWGRDNSENAIQVCVLNMVLNGDGKSNIKRCNSLQDGHADANLFNVVLCNPPFGVKIVEQSFAVLESFALGHQWERRGEALVPTEVVLKSQQTGLLFAELCVLQARPGGRIGIILPNGYLGNSSHTYLAFREWLLRHTRLVAVVAFPRFTFKKSGADVSASIVVLEKRSEPLARAADSESYPFYAGLVESVGYETGDNRNDPVYRKDPKTGAILHDAENEPIIDKDFDRVLAEFLASKAAAAFPWIRDGRSATTTTASHGTTSIREVLDRDDLSIDPKRWCGRVRAVRASVAKMDHFVLGDVVDVIPVVGAPADRTDLYRYVDIEATSDGAALPNPMRGWELPDRGRHRAAQGDLFVGNIWSSVRRWFVAGPSTDNLIVTNGFHRLRFKPRHLAKRLDVVAALCTETYLIQARAFATGSDGLASLSDTNLLEIVLPVVTSRKARTALGALVDALLAGKSSIATVVGALARDGELPSTGVRPRATAVVQV